ncbi:MAG: zinc ribbon domain-containing protein [Polyangiales bacterium]
MVCGNCGRQNPTGAIYCLDCGQRLRDTQGNLVASPFSAPAPATTTDASATSPTPSLERCPRCSVENPPGQRFCRMCGYGLAQGEPAASTGPGPGPAAPPAAPVASPAPAPAPAPSKVHCPRCGSAVERGVAFCGVCGLAAGEIPGLAAPSPAPLAPPPPAVAPAPRPAAPSPAPSPLPRCRRLRRCLPRLGPRPRVAPTRAPTTSARCRCSPPRSSSPS